MINLLMAFFISAGSVDIISLYPAEAYRAERLLPFHVQAAGLENIEIQSVELSVDKSQCNAAVDPYRADYFHIYCLSAQILDIDVIFKSADKLYQTNLTGLSVTSTLSDGGTGPTPTPTPAPTPDPIAIGRTIFQNDCQLCHASGLAPVSGIQAIKQAFAGISGMNQFIGRYTDEQLESIKEYVNSQ